MILWALLCCSNGSQTATDSGCDTSYSYLNFGKGFMDGNCQGCHASTAQNRYGAPENVHFDNESAVWEWKDRILIRTTGDTPDMPPAGGIAESELEALEEWLRCSP